MTPLHSSPHNHKHQFDAPAHPNLHHMTPTCFKSPKVIISFDDKSFGVLYEIFGPSMPMLLEVLEKAPSEVKLITAIIAQLSVQIASPPEDFTELDRVRFNSPFMNKESLSSIKAALNLDDYSFLPILEDAPHEMAILAVMISRLYCIPPSETNESFSASNRAETQGE